MTTKEALQVDTQVYDSLTSSAKLVGLWMTESRFDMSPVAVDAGAELAHSFRTVQLETTLEQGGKCLGVIQFEAVSSHKRKRVIQITAKYFVSYQVDSACTDALAKVFIDRVGRLAAYPYFRALVASLVGQAGIQVPALPILTIPPHYIRE